MTSRISVGFVAIAAFVASASGDPVTVFVTGSVFQGFQDIGFGAAVNGSFSYNTSVSPFGTVPGEAYYDKATLEGPFVIGGYAFNGPAGSQFVGDNYNAATGFTENKDRYKAKWLPDGSILQSGLRPHSLELFFYGPDTVLSGTALPSGSEFWDLNTNVFGVIRFMDEQGVGAGEALFGLQVTEVLLPLPGGAAMAMVGMGVIGVRRRRS